MSVRPLVLVRVSSVRACACGVQLISLAIQQCDGDIAPALAGLAEESEENRVKVRPVGPAVCMRPCYPSLHCAALLV